MFSWNGFRSHELAHVPHPDEPEGSVHADSRQPARQSASLTGALQPTGDPAAPAQVKP